MFDIIILYISSKKLKGSIFNNKRYKSVFDSMNNVCGEKMWNFVLDQKFSSFLTKVKKILENDSEIYLYIKFRLYSFVFSNLSLFSNFSHYCFCKRSCDHISSKELYCEFSSRIYPQIFDRQVCFQDIIIDERDFTLDFNHFLIKTSLFSLDICHESAISINVKNSKKYCCTYFCFIETPNILFNSYLSSSARVYFSYLFSVLEEVQLKEVQLITFRDEIWISACHLMHDFCLHVDINYFKRLFDNMRFSKQYSASCCRILNKHSVLEETEL